MNASPPLTARDEWRSYWPVVFVAMIAASLPSLHLYSTGVVIASVEQEMGWSRAQISSGPLMVSLLGLALAPFAGLAIDRFGARRMAITGTVAFLCSFALLSASNDDIWIWRGYWVLVALTAVLVAPTVWAAGVTSLFSKSRGMALAFTLAGTGLGAFSVPIVSDYLLQHYGWRAVYLGLSAIWAIAVLPLLLLAFTSLADRRRVEASRSDASAPVDISGIPFRRAALSANYIKLISAAALLALATNAIIINMVPVLRLQGLTASTAAATAGLIGISSITGRLLGGYLLDRIDARLVAGVAVLVPIISCALFILFPGEQGLLAIAVFLFGLAAGTEFDAVAYLTARLFGMKSFGGLFGTITGSLILVTGVGPLLANMVYDVSGSYLPVIYACIPMCLVSSVLFFSVRTIGSEF